MKWYTKLRLVLCLIGIAALGIYWCVDRYTPHPLLEGALIHQVQYVSVWKDGVKQDVTERTDRTELLPLLKQCERRLAFPWEGRREEEVLQQSPVEVCFIGKLDDGFDWRMLVGPEETVALDPKGRWYLITGGEALWQSLAPLLE